MKNSILILLLAAGFNAGAQNFENYFPYLTGTGDFVFTYSDGYAMSGITDNSEGESELFVVRTNLNGDTLWTKRFGLSGSNFIRCTTRDENGNIYVAPANADSVDLIKFSPEWVPIWTRKYDPSIVFKQMTLSEDKNLLMLGDMRPPNELYAITQLYKLDLGGNMRWQSDTLSIYGGHELCPSIVELNNSNIAVIINPTWFYEPPNSSIVFYLSNTGDSISAAHFPHHVLFDTYAIGNELLSVAFDHATNSNVMLGFLQDGTILSEKQLDLPENTDLDRFIPVTENGFIAVGTTSTDQYFNKRIILHRMSDSGDSLWTNYVGPFSDIWALDIALCPDNGYVISGALETSGKWTPLMAKTDSTGNINIIGINNENISSEIIVYPNPAKEYVIFESQNIFSGFISVSDCYGRIAEEIPVKDKKTVWNTSGVAPGVYLYKYCNEKSIYSGKIIIAR